MNPYNDDDHDYQGNYEFKDLPPLSIILAVVATTVAALVVFLN